MADKKPWVRSAGQVKLVTKPWGWATIDGVENVGELWLNYDRGETVGEEPKRYVMKKLFVMAGHSTSLQHHEKKEETNHLISGEAEVWMENESGELEVTLFQAGDSWDIPPGRKHRLIALTNIEMVEASTPEVDDVVRHADDAGRGDGRIESEHQN